MGRWIKEISFNGERYTYSGKGHNDFADVISLERDFFSGKNIITAINYRNQTRLKFIFDSHQKAKRELSKMLKENAIDRVKKKPTNIFGLGG